MVHLPIGVRLWAQIARLSEPVREAPRVGRRWHLQRPDRGTGRRLRWRTPGAAPTAGVSSSVAVLPEPAERDALARQVVSPRRTTFPTASTTARLASER